MKEVMKHLTDDSLYIHLVRYHNTQAWDKLRELSDYLQMLLARIENQNSSRVIAAEVDVISHDAQAVASHLRNAEMFTNTIAQEKSREVVDQTITETEALAAGGIASMGVVGGRKKEVHQ